MHPQSTAEAMTQDTELVQQLVIRLQNRLGSDLRDLRVTIEAGGLILQGRTNTYYGKQLAQQAVMEFSEVRIFANQIEVL
jgi:osmotically-inducible protein OsmY